MRDDEDATGPYVSVRGEAVLEVEAELAHLTVTVNGRDRQRQPAVDLLARRNEAVLAKIAEFGGGVERVETTQIRVHPWYREGRATDRPGGYVAQATHTLTVVDFSMLGYLSVELADEDNVTLFGPMWSLRRDSEAHRQARLQAVDDAIRRARDYAGALGSQVTGLVHLADVGLLAEGSPGMPGGTMRKSGGAVDAAPPLTLEPQRQIASARIEARFTISPPDLGDPDPASSTPATRTG